MHPTKANTFLTRYKHQHQSHDSFLSYLLLMSLGIVLKYTFTLFALLCF